MAQSQRLSLSELTSRISRALDEAFLDSVWVAAEVSELNENRTGHCYLELVEKDTKNPNSPQLKAKVRGTIWARDYRMLRTYFESTTGRRLSAGIKVLVMCHVNFHHIYGLSLNIVDIDPAYTLGDIELQRQETIQKLVTEGIFDMNRELEFPILPKRVAIVSSPTAAGYQDFIHQLDGNPYGFTIIHNLFTATMQGDGADESISVALDAVYHSDVQWDMVAIIRGGGSQTDLSCFDSYMLASHIAQFPIPVITGIGHEKDTSIADMVAHTRLKTPTAAAEFIIDRFAVAEGLLHDTIELFVQSVQDLISQQLQHLNDLHSRMVPSTLRITGTHRLQLQRLEMVRNDMARRLLTKERNGLRSIGISAKAAISLVINQQEQLNGAFAKRLSIAQKHFMAHERSRIASLSKAVDAFDPTNILKRGYSITMFNGKRLLNPNEVKAGDEVETILLEGRMRSRRV